MNDYFESEIKKIQKEILDLKTSAQKSAIVVPSVSKTVNIKLKLEIIDSGNPRASTSFLIETNSRALVFATLNQYFDDIYLNDHLWSPNTRKAKILISKISKLEYFVGVDFEGNEDDWVTIRGGGTVEMSRTLTVRCTDDFRMTEI